MSEMITITVCSIDRCPILEKCPVGARDGGTCPIKHEYMQTVNDMLQNVYADQVTDPLVSMKVNFLLVPLFEQLLSLRMEEYSPKQGVKVVGILKEIRSCVKAIDSVANSIVSNKVSLTSGKIKNIESKDDYYSMLLEEGTSGPDKAVGLHSTSCASN